MVNFVIKIIHPSILQLSCFDYFTVILRIKSPKQVLFKQDLNALHFEDMWDLFDLSSIKQNI